MKTKSFFILVFILIMIAMASCNKPASGEKPTGTEIPVIHSATPTNLVIATMTPTPFREVTKTFLPSPTKAIDSIKIEELINSNNCEMPCWLGIKPGITQWTDAESLLNSLNFIKPWRDNFESWDIFYYYGPFFNNDFNDDKYDFYVKDNMVSAINILSLNAFDMSKFRSSWRNWSPEAIVNQYGEPDRIDLKVDFSPEKSDYAGINLRLTYLKEGFVITYFGMSYLGKDLVFCPGFTNSMNMVDYLDIWLTASDQTTVPEPPENYFLSISSVWKNIQEATGISKEKFAKNLQLDGQNFCFSTPLSLWANW